MEAEPCSNAEDYRDADLDGACSSASGASGDDGSGGGSDDGGSDDGGSAGD